LCGPTILEPPPDVQHNPAGGIAGSEENRYEDYDAMTETAYLLRNPANAERLLAAIERARRGEFEQHDLSDA
jgi:hypothetical protein